MSGGAFNYKQYEIITIADSIQSEIDNNGKERKAESWEDKKEKHYHSNYNDETINEFKKGVMLLKLAHVYAQRIDWLLSGDDGEQTFHRRLKEELSKITGENE
jgi:hypothetical protein